MNRISHQVDNVLDFIRDVPMERKETSVKECISNSIKEVKIPKNIIANVTGQDHCILADSYQLEVVFKNLIINAIQAINKKEGEILITVSDDKDFLGIVFEDSADFLEDSQVEQIFEFLYTTKQEGTGMGLISCKQIIERHGGEIHAKTHPTRFIIKLPKK